MCKNHLCGTCAPSGSMPARRCTSLHSFGQNVRLWPCAWVSVGDERGGRRMNHRRHFHLFSFYFSKKKEFAILICSESWRFTGGLKANWIESVATRIIRKKTSQMQIDGRREGENTLTIFSQTLTACVFIIWSWHWRLWVTDDSFISIMSGLWFHPNRL